MCILFENNHFKRLLVQRKVEFKTNLAHFERRNVRVSFLKQYSVWYRRKGHDVTYIMILAMWLAYKWIYIKAHEYVMYTNQALRRQARRVLAYTISDTLMLVTW
jgi:hypothetical protein